VCPRSDTCADGDAFAQAEANVVAGFFFHVGKQVARAFGQIEENGCGGRGLDPAGAEPARFEQASASRLAVWRRYQEVMQVHLPCCGLQGFEHGGHQLGIILDEDGSAGDVADAAEKG